MGTLPLNVRIDKGWRSCVCEREKEKQVVSSSIRLSAQYEQPSSPQCRAVRGEISSPGMCGGAD